MWKRENAGFVGQPMNVELEGPPDICILDCGDPDCQEWPNARIVDQDIYVYHLSECEIEDARAANDTGMQHEKRSP